MNATISADIVSSTMLSEEETIALKKHIAQLFTTLESKFAGFWGRQIKGDYIECLVPDINSVFRIALILKTFIKSFEIQSGKDKKNFQTYGIRIAIGIGDMRIVNRTEGIMDGEAIYISGRALDKMGSVNKGTMTIGLHDNLLQSALNVIVILTDALINHATRRQCEVLFYKLLMESECDIAEKLNINQSAVNQHSSAAKWYSIEESLKYFENLNFVSHDD